MLFMLILVCACAVLVGVAMTPTTPNVATAKSDAKNKLNADHQKSVTRHLCPVTDFIIKIEVNRYFSGWSADADRSCKALKFAKVLVYLSMAVSVDHWPSGKRNGKSAAWLVTWS